MKTYLEMNEKVADILQHGGKIEQYAAQYIEELRKENAELKHRAEVAERALKSVANVYRCLQNHSETERRKKKYITR